ncbi:MAG: histidine phosphatase family protein, partial [Myxococcota bacterium]|nr:histidine phosphatase family protein [Myxococcota bacterium]
FGPEVFGGRAVSEIYLIRHGQASFGAADYDKLSELGERQARAAGASLGHLGSPAILASGTMRRHLGTCRGFLESYAHDVPEVREDAAFNEYDHDAVLAAVMEGWMDPDARMRWFAEQDHPGRAFHELFLKAAARWVSGAHEEDYEEPFAVFSARVKQGLERVTRALQPDEDAIIFTSGGVISALAREVLRFPDEVLVEVNLSMLNAGLTHLRYTRRGLQLVTFNSASHLAVISPELVTHY